MNDMKEKFKSTVIIIIVFVVLAGGAYLYHTGTIAKLKKEFEKETEQKALLEDRIEEINEKLKLKTDENDTLLEKIDALLTSDEYYFDSEAMSEEIKKIGELATIEYRYTNVGTLDASKKLFKTDIDIPLSKKTVVMTMDGVMKIGMDVSGIKISCNELSKTIIVTLPKTKMISNELDEESIKIYNETDGLFNKVTLEDSSGLRKQIKEKSEANAKTNGVYDQATENAKDVIKTMLEAVPGLKNKYKIEFR